MHIDALRVCSLEKLENQVDAFDATHLISLLGAEYYFVRPEKISESSHLVMRFKDTEVKNDSSAPQYHHIKHLNRWVEGLPGDRRVLIHCVAGLSRSTAVALGLLAKQVPASTAVERMFQLQPYATPDRLIVRHWDKLLKHNGALIEALNAHQKARLEGNLR